MKNIVLITLALALIAGKTPDESAMLSPPADRKKNNPSNFTRSKVYISPRTDGVAGSGTLKDPYDGSTAAKYDAIIAKLPQNADVILDRGIFLTKGLPEGATSGPILPKGTRLTGRGMYATSIKLAQYPESWTEVAAKALVVGNNKFSPLPNGNVTLEDLTIDANWQNLNSPYTNKAIHCAMLWGSNNTIRNVRAINMHGDANSGMECFALMMYSQSRPGTNNVIRSCLIESPRGTYQAAIALFGDGRAAIMSHSRVENCRVTGRFESGGVNLGYNADLIIRGNYFYDCRGVYNDTGNIDRVLITNNVFDRIYYGGVMFVPGQPLIMQHIKVVNNKFTLINNVREGHTYGVILDGSYGPATFMAPVIQSNTFVKDARGSGYRGWRAVTIKNARDGAVSDNTGDASMEYFVETGRITLRRNRDLRGAPLLNLRDNIVTGRR